MTARIPMIDALRGLAAAVVVFHHAFTHFPATFAALPSAALRAACAFISDLNVEAVLVFFVVSGFSIRLSIARLALDERSGINEYVYRRAKRILPLYVFSLAFAGLCAVAAGVPVPPESLDGWTLAGNLLFLQTSAGIPGNWIVPYAGNGPLWSLSFEVFYYALFPLHYTWSRHFRWRFASALAISAVGFAINVLVPNPLAQFAANYAIWYAGVELAERHLGARPAPLALAAGAWVALSAATLSLNSTTLRSLWVGMTLFWLGQGLLFVASQRRSAAAAAAPPLGMRPLVWLGSISYALYLLHFPVLRTAAHLAGDTPGALLLALLGSIGLAFAAERASLVPRYEFLRRRYV